MPAIKRVYKVDRRDVEKMVALFAVTNKKEEHDALIYFCETFNIPLDKAAIKAQVAEYEVLQAALKEATEK